MAKEASPRVIDNDRDEITVTLGGKELRGWSYRDEAERRVKMLAAREFCEGWFQASERRASPPDAGVRVKALDLSNLLKHAFLSGVVAARNIPPGNECDGPALWVDYDPETCPAYGRIKSALEPSPSPDASVREALKKSRRVIEQIVLAAIEEDTISEENGDDKWFAENGSEALEAIDAALKGGS